MSFLTIYFNHAAAAGIAAQACGFEGSTDLFDFSLRLSKDGKSHRWTPRFFMSIEGQLGYADRPGKGTIGFAGWTPYGIRRWDLSTDKSAFKRYAIAHSIPVPQACFNPGLIGGPFIIKKANSSFGQGLRGPYLKYEPGNEAHRLQPEEYYENFIVGHIAKVWCWGRTCVAVHLHKPGIVEGDGSRTLRDLIKRLPNLKDGEDDWGTIGHLARYCGLGDVDEVVPAGKEVLVEYRYGSRYEPPARHNLNTFASLGETSLGRQFAAAAEAFAAGIEGEPGWGPSFFSLDAIVDSEGMAWFLEMNSNPLVHPDLYLPMMQSAAALGDS